MFNRKKVKSLNEEISSLKELISRTLNILDVDAYPRFPVPQLRSYLDEKFEEKKQELREAEIRRIAEQVYIGLTRKDQEAAAKASPSISSSGIGGTGSWTSPSYKE